MILRIITRIKVRFPIRTLNAQYNTSPAASAAGQAYWRQNHTYNKVVDINQWMRSIVSLAANLTQKEDWRYILIFPSLAEDMGGYWILASDPSFVWQVIQHTSNKIVCCPREASETIDRWLIVGCYEPQQNHWSLLSHIRSRNFEFPETEL
jgi:hypothetical protein